jgi:hypothetical protein
MKANNITLLIPERIWMKGNLLLSSPCLQTMNERLSFNGRNPATEIILALLLTSVLPTKSRPNNKFLP